MHRILHFFAHTDRKQLLIGSVLLVALLAEFFAGLWVHFPQLGQDYFYFFPRLLAGKWHFAHEGLLPFRFDPHFCGGLPMYGNPQDMFYSLEQLLILFLDPWVATQCVLALTIVAGYWGWYRFGRDVLALRPSYGHLLALAVAANGFYFMHVIQGHLTFLSIPLLGWALWLLCAVPSPEEERWSVLSRVALFSLLTAYIFYGGGYIVLMMLALLVLTVVPALLILLQRQARAWATYVSWCAIGALAVCASKLVAIWSFMRYFPRTADFFPFSDKASALWIIVKELFGLPQTVNLYAEVQSRYLSIFEVSMFVSPAVLVGCVCAGAALLSARSSVRTQWKKMLSLALYVLFVTIVYVQLIRGYGAIASALHALPILSSWRVTVRFLYIPSLFLTMVGVWGLQWAEHRVSRRKHASLVWWASIVVTLLSPILAYGPLLLQSSTSDLSLIVNINDVRSFLRQIDVTSRDVTLVQDFRDTDTSDFQYVLEGSSGVSCYEQLYKNNQSPLRAGPTDAEWGGAFNLHNPACFQYPEENHCAVGDRVALNDRRNLSLFVRGETPGWHLSLLQWVADGISFLTLIAAVAVPTIVAVRKRIASVDS